jgi:dTDP-4-dehydrorhamnose reductase
MVADQRLNPTFTRDLAAGLIAAVEKDARGILHITNSGACSWHEFTVEIMRLAGIDVPIEAVETTRAPGGVDRPLNGVLARPRTDAAGLAPLRSWRDALADYLA